MNTTQHPLVIKARGRALQSLVSIANAFEMDADETAAEAANVCWHHGLAVDEAGPLLVAFNDLSADEFTALAGGSYPDVGESKAAPWA